MRRHQVRHRAFGGQGGGFPGLGGGVADHVTVVGPSRVVLQRHMPAEVPYLHFCQTCATRGYQIKGATSTVPHFRSLESDTYV